MVYDADDNYCYTLEWEYNRFGKVTREVDALGLVTIRDYDVDGNMIREEAPKPGLVTLYEYNLAGQPISKEVQDLNLVETYEYNPMGHMTVSRDIFGRGTVHKYDNFGRNIETVLPNLPGEHGLQPVSIRKKLDVLGNVTHLTDPLGRTTKTIYNSYNKPIIITYPDGTEEKFTYNLNDTLKTHTAKNGTVTKYEWDCLKRMTSKTVISSEEVLSTETKTYSHFSLISETDTAGLVTTYTYDGAGRKTSTVIGDRRTTYEYDPLGRLHIVKTWLDGTQFTAAIKEFDFLDRVIEERIEDETGQIFLRKFFEYDEVGNKTKVIDGSSVTETEYNALGSPTKITDPEGNVTTIQYRYNHTNEYGQKVLQTITTDPKGIITTETYNTHNKPVIIEKRNSLGEVIQRLENHYDFCGNCLETLYTVITPNQEDRTITNHWDYDPLNRPLRLIEAMGSDDERITLTTYTMLGTIESVTKPNGIVIRHTYNDLGLLTRQHSETLDDHYTYDKHNNIILVEDKIHGFTTTREYNEYSDLVFEKLGNGHTASFDYDTSGRLTDVIIDDKHVHYTYDAAHLREITYRGLTHTYDAHDLSGRVTKSTLIGSAGNLTLSYDLNGREINRDHFLWKEVDIRYDQVGNLIYKKKIDPLGTQHLHFEYDDLDQLSYEETKGACHYLHDSLNNRVTKGDSDYKLNDLNQLITTDEHIFEYDENGNTTTHKTPDVDTHYTYDALDRLITIKEGSSITCYTYDAFNRRLKTEHDDETITYIYSQNNEVGSVSSSGKKEFRVLGQGLGAEIGAAVLIELGNQILTPLHDISGSVVCLINSNTGKLFEAYRYTPFGELIDSCYGNKDNPWLFASKRHDPSGFINFGRRYYDSQFGRWVTCDPQGFTDGPNLYAYVNNNPLTHFDEYGLFDGYWDTTAEEAAMYNPMAQWEGMKCAAFEVRNLFFGSTYELSTSVSSEFWGDPNDLDRVTPISHRGWGEISLLVGGTVLECSPAKFLGFGGKVIKFLGKGVTKIPAVNKTIQVARRGFYHLWRGKKVTQKIIQNTTKQNSINAKIVSIQQKFFGASPKNEQKILSLKNELNEWLGEGTRMIKNKAKDPIFISKDEMRKVRFDFNRPNPHQSSHMHIETFQQGEWVDNYGQIYPNDIPHH